MKKILYMLMVSILIPMSIVTTSCSKDGDDEPGVSTNLTSATMPSKVGWSGNFDNGIATYTDNNHNDPDEIPAYMAFSFKNGICNKGVVNLVLPSEAIAKQFAEMMNSGDWSGLEDDDDYDDYSTRSSVSKSIFKIECTRSMLKSATRSNEESLPINVSRDGNVVYMVITCVEGLTSDEIKTVVTAWTTGNYPSDRVMFGKYENGVYVCNNMRGIGMDYRIDTSYNSDGFCTKYTTTVKMPTRAWAQVMYQSLYEDIQYNKTQYLQIYGGLPELSISGTTIILDAVINGDLTESQVFSTIVAIDWMNNSPILWDMFE